jgi:hypothetical protein
MNKEKIASTIKRCWSIHTSSKWEQDNPAKGQCPVTALVIQDNFGGRLLKTRVDGQWHFYNEVDGVIFDFTDSQFAEPIKYENLPASRKEAFAGTNQEQYTHLSRKFSATWAGD